MINSDSLIINLQVFAVVVPMLLAVAYVTIVERKVLGSLQRRVGPNSVGVLGLLQPFSDALKLILKETIIPSQANKVIFILAPVSTLVFSLLGWAIIPYGFGLTVSDYSMGIFYSMALSSLGIYGILLSGWSANSKYAFLGSLRSSAAMVSYELILSSTILIIIFIVGSLNYFKVVESQQAFWFIVPIFSIFLLYFISVLAETSRTPFDLQEAESELVAGFMTEHSATVFVFFFLGEYSSIVLFSTISALLFMGGFNFIEIFQNETIFSLQSIILGVKSCAFAFLFVWVRATLPRYRYDQLIDLCWLNLLPMVVACVVLIPSILVALNAAPLN